MGLFSLWCFFRREDFLPLCWTSHLHLHHLPTYPSELSSDVTSSRKALTPQPGLGTHCHCISSILCHLCRSPCLKGLQLWLTVGSLRSQIVYYKYISSVQHFVNVFEFMNHSSCRSMIFFTSYDFNVKWVYLCKFFLKAMFQVIWHFEKPARFLKYVQDIHSFVKFQKQLCTYYVPDQKGTH